jgi:hypothetical protein
MAKEDKSDTSGSEGRTGRQPRPGRNHQLRRSKVLKRLVLSGTGAAEQKPSKAGAAAQQPRQAAARQIKAVKESRTSIPSTLVRARPVQKVQLARAMQPRQLSTTKSLGAAVADLDQLIARPPIGKVISARTAQVKQRASIKFKGQIKAK